MAGAIKSTGKKNYTTPEWIVEEVRKFFWKLRPDGNPAGIDLDPCSNPESLVKAALNIMLEEPPVAEHLTTKLVPVTENGEMLMEQRPFFTSRFVKGDGLKASWESLRTYVNPPFGYDKVTKLGIANWIVKGSQEALRGAEVVLCIPDAPETKFWKNLILLKAQGRCQLARRVKFGGMSTGITKPIALVYFGSNPDLFKDHFKTFGRVENPSVVYADQASISL